MRGMDAAFDQFPEGFFDRADEADDTAFYAQPRLVQHLDDRARSAVGDVYSQLGVGGRVLDLMGSWVSHLKTRPDHLTVLGMNADELAQNPWADGCVVHDLNRTASLPFAEQSFDAATCTVSVDYLRDPVPVFRSVRSVLAPGGVFVCTFSNRLFPTKAVRGWLHADGHQRCAIVERYFLASGGWTKPTSSEVFSPGPEGDPLWAVWSRAE